MTKNEHTGATLITKPATDLFREGWERVFGGASVEVSTGVCETPSEGSIPRATPKIGFDADGVFEYKR